MGKKIDMNFKLDGHLFTTQEAFAAYMEVSPVTVRRYRQAGLSEDRIIQKLRRLQYKRQQKTRKLTKSQILQFVDERLDELDDDQ